MQISSDISEHVEMFSAFRHTLSRLTVGCCGATTSALVTLLNYFSGLDRLDLIYLLHEVDYKPAPPLSRPLVRELRISEFYPHRCGLDIFEELSELGLRFDEVVVDGQTQVPLSALSRIIGTLGVKSKRLKLLQPFEQRMYVSPSRTSPNQTPTPTDNPGDGFMLLSRCRELQELELAVGFLGFKEVAVLSSITSTRIQKVTLVFQHSWHNVNWKIFDKPLCRLADQLGCAHRLEVDIRTIVTEVGEVAKIVDSLAGFREKGEIRVVRVRRGEGN